MTPAVAPSRRSIERLCEQCGSGFMTSALYVARGQGRFCSRDCSSRARRGAGVNRITPIEQRFWPKVQKSDGCWLWTGSRNPLGYGSISVFDGNRKKSPEPAHRVSWQLHFGLIPDGLWVLHRCDNPPCVRPDHLFLGTPADNSHDMWAKGRGRPSTGARHGAYTHPESVRRGEQLSNAKLTSAQVVAIRELYAAGGVTTRELGVRFGVCHQTVSLIARRVQWAHV